MSQTQATAPVMGCVLKYYRVEINLCNFSILNRGAPDLEWKSCKDLFLLDNILKHNPSLVQWPESDSSLLLSLLRALKLA